VPSQAFERGDFRWVAEVVNHLVFADPENQEAGGASGVAGSVDITPASPVPVQNATRDTYVIANMDTCSGQMVIHGARAEYTLLK
jgi:alkyl sulfatase BDS1-like metallo-beta-lactamase superfamily hydrolase